jgi:hypothetical protein
MKKDLLKKGALGALVGGTFLSARQSVSAQEEIAAAGNGGTAEASANGGAVAVGDVNSGGNTGNVIGIGDTSGAMVCDKWGKCYPGEGGSVAVDGGAVANSTTLDINANGGTAIADASGGDYNVAFLDDPGFLS